MIQLIAVEPQNLLTINNIQKRSFKKSYEKHGDLATSPFTRTLGEVDAAVKDKQHPYFFLIQDEKPVGYVRLGSANTIRQIQIMPLGLLPEVDTPELRQEAVAAVEKQYSNADSYLIETIFQEAEQLAVYQDLGYELQPEKQILQAGLTLVRLVKQIKQVEAEAPVAEKAADKVEPEQAAPVIRGKKIAAKNAGTKLQK